MNIFRTFETPPVWGVFVAFYQMMIIFLLPVMLMSSSYYKVIKALWRSTKNMTVLTNSRPFSMEQAEEDEAPPAEGSATGSVYQLRPFTIRTSFRPSPGKSQEHQMGTFYRKYRFLFDDHI